MTSLETENTISWLMLKWAIIYYLCFIPFRYWTQNRALKKIKTMLQEGEEIIYKPKFNYTIGLVVPLSVGAFFGGFILPFYLYPEIQNIMLLYRKYLFIGIIAEIVCLWVSLMVACSRWIITNKRVLRIYAFDFINKFFKPISVNFADLKSLKSVKYFGGENINMIKPNNRYTYITGFKNMKKIKEIMDGQINSL